MSEMELQLALARMLPEKITQRRDVKGHAIEGGERDGESVVDKVSFYHDRFFWVDSESTIRSTEWLYVVWLVEQGLNEQSMMTYTGFLYSTVQDCGGKWPYNASWQQRAAALIEVKTPTLP